jgi:hypothetical protein
MDTMCILDLRSCILVPVHSMMIRIEMQEGGYQ